MDAYVMMAAAVEEHKKNNGGKLDVSAIAKAAGIRYNQAYYPLVGQRKPNATIWMKLMEALGHKVSIGGADDLNRLHSGPVQGF